MFACQAECTVSTQLHAAAQAPWGTIACEYLQSCMSPTAMYMPQPVVPTVDPSQLAAQQQAFINQQAMLMVSGRDWVGEAPEQEKENALVYVL